MNATEKRALVIGGSLAGLFAGTLLRSIGWQVDIYERSPHTLDSRGGGIVLQPDVVEAFELPDILTDRNGQRRDYSIAPGMIHPTVEQAMRCKSGQALGDRSQLSLNAIL